MLRYTSLAHIIMAYHQALPLNGRSSEKSYKRIILPLNYFMHKKQKYYYSLFLAELHHVIFFLKIFGAISYNITHYVIIPFAHFHCPVPCSFNDFKYSKFKWSNILIFFWIIIPWGGLQVSVEKQP